MNNKDIDTKRNKFSQLFSRYFEGKITYEEYELLKIEQEKIADEELEKLIENQWNKYENTNNEIPQHLFSNITNHIVRKPEKKVKLWLSVAASILILFIGGSTIWFLSKNQQNYITYSTDPINSLQLTLPDGSIAKLEPNTKISSFDNKSSERKIELIHGELWLDVKKDPQKPFVVKCSDIQINVLGTTFSIKNNKEDHNIETNLFEGSIMISSELFVKNIYLEPNQKAIFDKKMKTITIENFDDIKNETDELVFASAPLSEVFSTMEKHYNVNLICTNNNLKNIADPYTASFKNIPLTDLLEILSMHYNFKYHITDRVIHVYLE